MKKSKKLTHQYYDISLKNNTNAPIIAKLFENRTSAMLENPSDYFYSCVRFQIPTAYLPLFVWPNSNGVADNTYYTVGIHYYTGTQGAYQTNVVYVPLNDTTAQTDPAYFFVYSFQQMVDAINTALNASYTALKTANPGASVSTPPYLEFEASTGLFSIVAETAYANSNYKLFFNGPLYGFFDNFEAKRFTNPAVVGEDYNIFIKNNGNNSVTGTLYGSTSSYKMTQEYKSLFNWYDVRSIVFVSNTVGVADEAINVNSANVTNTGNTYQKILTDFQLNTDEIPRSYLQYVPFGEYRLIDMVATSPLYMFDVQIFFKTGDQTLYPLYILPDETVDIKNMFRLKTFDSKL